MKLIFKICIKVTYYDSGVQGEALRQNMIRQTCEYQSGVESRKTSTSTENVIGTT